MNKISVIGLGNDILGDDAIGLISVRELKKKYGSKIDIFESPNGGLELLDYLEGYEYGLILDSLYTGEYPAGKIIKISSSDLTSSLQTTPHYVGLPEVLQLAKKININMPKEIVLLLIEVVSPYEVTYEMSDPIKNKKGIFINNAEEIIDSFSSND